MPGTPGTAGGESASRAEHADGDRLASAAHNGVDDQPTAHGAATAERMISVGGDTEAHDIRKAASAAAATAASIAISTLTVMASATTRTAASVAPVIQQAVKAVTDPQGSSAESSVQTAGEKQDMVDTILALGVVLGLCGVLIVGGLDVVGALVLSHRMA